MIYNLPGGVPVPGGALTPVSFPPQTPGACLTFFNPGEMDRAAVVYPSEGAATLGPDDDLRDGLGRVIARRRDGSWRLEGTYAGVIGGLAFSHWSTGR